MTPDEQINAIALNLQGLINGLDQRVSRLVGKNQHEIILVIGCADQSQYASNSTRERGIKALSDLYARWKLNLPEVMPGEVGEADTAGFQYLLALLETAIATGDTQDAKWHRANLIAYVGQLAAEVNRSRAR